MTLVGVGHALADAFAFVDEDVPKTMGLHPGTFNRVPDYRMRAILATLRQKNLMAGGSAANTVKLAARLGVDAHFVGQCGHDEAGQIFEGELLGSGVKVNLTKSDSPTGLCVTFLSQQDRTVATVRSASGDLPLGLVGDTLLGAADVVVVEGYLLDEPDFLDDLLARCVAARKAVIFDTGESALVEAHRDALAGHLKSGRIRYFFLRESDAATLTGLKAEDAMAELLRFAELVVLKRGNQGYLVGSAAKTVAIPTAESVPVDASGSGDGFQAGFLWALDRGWRPVEACRAGSLVAACIAQQPGTRIDPIRWARLLTELHSLENSLQP